jgi:hypothetical protein
MFPPALLDELEELFFGREKLEQEGGGMSKGWAAMVG